MSNMCHLKDLEQQELKAMGYDVHEEEECKHCLYDIPHSHDMCNEDGVFYTWTHHADGSVTIDYE